MPFEIERKFLVRGEDFKQRARSASRISQGYICSANGRTVRIRIRDEKGFLTIKGPSDKAGLSRYEFEQEIELADALDLIAICEPGVIDKTRYLVDFEGHTFEVDEFYGDNAGLVLAEVELNSEQEYFVRPDFLGREVTGDRRFYNAHMRAYPYKLWKEDIREWLEE